jgi:PAS domain S-box-containing protein
MASEINDGSPVADLVESPVIAEALASDHFKTFLDQIPIAVAVSEIAEPERIVYANLEFEKLTGQRIAELTGKPWSILDRHHGLKDTSKTLGAEIVAGTDFVGTVRMEGPEDGVISVVDGYSHIIVDDTGKAVFRLAALVDVTVHQDDGGTDLATQLREKDTLLREIQHRVKNNLQMITALIRLETRQMPRGTPSDALDRLAGRIESLALLYQSLAHDGDAQQIDLGVYLTQIATAVLQAHAVEGIRLNLKVDAYPVSVNVAMPAGLVVNELLTNSLKHAFTGRDGGTITLHSVTDDNGCRVTVADDGNGLPRGVHWPMPGKLSSLIAQSLRENAKAQIHFESDPGLGTRVTIVFSRAAAEADFN